MGLDADTVAFVCVQNAGRSQMATAFARRELDSWDIEHGVEVLTGGTRPAASVHPEVIEVMREVDVDLSDHTPREITPAELQLTDIVITMGCSADDVCPATWDGDSRDWDLEDPHGRSLEVVREIRDEIHARVVDLVAEIHPEQSIES